MEKRAKERKGREGRAKDAGGHIGGERVGQGGASIDLQGAVVLLRGGESVRASEALTRAKNKQQSVNMIDGMACCQVISCCCAFARGTCPSSSRPHGDGAACQLHQGGWPSTVGRRTPTARERGQPTRAILDTLTAVPEPLLSCPSSSDCRCCFVCTHCWDMSPFPRQASRADDATYQPTRAIRALYLSTTKSRKRSTTGLRRVLVS